MGVRFPLGAQDWTMDYRYMKTTVYILQSYVDNSYYIGTTVDLEERLIEHNSGTKGYTSRIKPWKVVYIEEYQTRTEALKREKYLKNLKSKKYIEKMIRLGP